MPIAEALQANLTDDAGSKRIYSEVGRMTNDLKAVIFGNFYAIMNHEGKIQNGNIFNWGELVFLESTNLSQLVQNVTPAQLNDYRLLALIMTIGEARTS